MEILDYSKDFIELIEANGDVYWQYNPQTQELFVSDQIYKILGYDKSINFIDLPFWNDIIHPLDKNRASENFTKMKEGELSRYESEIRIKKQDGSYTWILTRAKAVKTDENDKPVFIVGTHIDINKDKQYQEKMEQLNKRFSNMFQNHDAVMLLIDPKQNIIVDANKSAEHFYGYTHDELCGMNVHVINPLSQEELKKKQQEALFHKHNFFIFQHLTKSGDRKNVEVHSSPIKTDEGELLFFDHHGHHSRKSK